VHLSRLAEELVVWSSVSFNFVRLADEFTSGSSIMPQKRNPDVAEIVRGKTGRICGDLSALLMIMKGLPLSYNRDMQEDKPPVFDAADALKDCLGVAAPMVRTMSVKADSMAAALEQGFPAATELADFLARNNVPFRSAHRQVKDIVAYCSGKGKALKDLTVEELKRFSPLFTAECLALVKPENIVSRKRSEGGTSPASVRKQISRLKNSIQSARKVRA
jgi:argininosuccinate lyase